VAEQDALDQVFGIAPQLTVTNGPCMRVEPDRIALATSSLPTPDSPSMSTGMSGGGLACQPHDPLHGRAGADEISKGECLLATAALPVSPGVFDGTHLERAFERRAQTFGGCRLDDEIERARPHGRDRHLDAALRGLYDDGHVKAPLAHGFEHVQTVEPRHDEVEYDCRRLVRATGFQMSERGLAALCGHRLVAELGMVASSILSCTGSSSTMRTVRDMKGSMNSSGWLVGLTCFKVAHPPKQEFKKPGECFLMVARPRLPAVATPTSDESKVQ
jgi:hypothetical protein